MNHSSLPSKNFFGQRGEDLAAQYLRSRGYRIVARNFRLSHRELDIVAWRDGFFHFCEIKTRQEKTSESFLLNSALTDALIGRRQIINLKRAALDYAAQNHLCLEKCFFDLIVVLIAMDDSGAKLKHYREIF